MLVGNWCLSIAALTPTTSAVRAAFRLSDTYPILFHMDLVGPQVLNCPRLSTLARIITDRTQNGMHRLLLRLLSQIQRMVHIRYVISHRELQPSPSHSGCYSKI